MDREYVDPTRIGKAKTAELTGSLVAINGIGEPKQSVFNKLDIISPDDLLRQGISIDQRRDLADRVWKTEGGGLDPDQSQVEVNYNRVTSYVKQANLWQVADMDPDTAYFLVQMGIRHVEDLQKADPEAIYTNMLALWRSQPQYDQISLKEIDRLIINAVEIEGLPPYFPDNTDSLYLTIECDDPAPVHLFREKVEPDYPASPQPAVSLDSDQSLVPVKGIGIRRNELFAEIGIPTAAALLQNGRFISQRESMASKITDAQIRRYSRQVSQPQAEKMRESYEKIISSSVKQIDLWRVEGMDTDTAFFLVQMGVRFVQDLSMVDVEKAYPILIKQSLVQPEYQVIGKDGLQLLVDNATAISDDNSLYQEQLGENFEAILKKHVPGIDEDKLKSIRDSFYVEGRLKGGAIECDDDPPYYLFRTVAPAKEAPNNDDLYYGLSILRDLEMVLPLPRIIRGMVIFHEKETTDTDSNLLYGAAVEVIGVSSPVTDKTEDSGNPCGYLDGDGRFIIVLPEQYNLKDSVVLRVSKDKYEQSFNFTASDVLDHVKENKILRRLKDLQILLSEKTSTWDEHAFSNLASDEEVAAILHEVGLEELSMQAIGAVLNDLLSCDRLEAVFGESDDLSGALVINPFVFKNIRSKAGKVLPSVKLMENNGESTYLPTDTAPSQIFSYSILNRLTEPSMTQNLGVAPFVNRRSLEQRINVTDFKNTIAMNPEQWPQVSSLAIGYILNMQQSWIPDGFSLGSLLYSLVLAPGEEQKLIVREKSQSYTLRDEGDAKDYTAQEYTTDQDDNMMAAYEYALNQLAEGNSAMQYKTSSSSLGVSGSIAGSGGGIGGSLGIGYGKSSSKGGASSSASQANSHNEISNSAQAFQHGIKTASEKISQAQRMAISLASSAESQSVATKIIANHNHSHAMTIQYWEVMRRYTLETCISGVDLVLFIPLQLIRFLNGQSYILTQPGAVSAEQGMESVMNPDIFNVRYEVLLKYADTLLAALPHSYRTGMNLIKQFAALPNWMLEKTSESAEVYTITFQGIFLPFDDISADMVLKNGGGIIAGEVEYERNRFVSDIKQSTVLKESIKAIRNLSPTASKTHESLESGRIVKRCTCTFHLPPGYCNEDIQYIRIRYSCDALNYVLHKDPTEQTADGKTAEQIEQAWVGKYWNLVMDRKDSAGDIRKMEYFKSFMPEAYVTPNVRISPSELMGLGALRISAVQLKKENVNISQTGTELTSTIYVTVRNNVPVMRYQELQQIESTLQHIASHTMKYSQTVWNALSSDERALLLEQYTIEMDFSDILGEESEEGNNSQKEKPITIPLLNCINVKKMLGFYGNSMLFPFTYPQALADRIGKTAGELQDSLYRYHTNYFRVPTTVVSLPTDGMIGEAVLGETNVSEKIDLTRFWNWKDSPIERMNLDNTYLDNADSLAGKTTKEITPLNMEGALPTNAVTVPDLLTAMVNKQAPNFSNLTGLEQLAQVLNTATNTTAAGRDAALKSATESMKNALEYSYKAGEKKKEKDGEVAVGGDSDSETTGDGATSSGATGGSAPDSGASGGGATDSGAAGSGATGSGARGSGVKGGNTTGDGSKKGETTVDDVTGGKATGDNARAGRKIGFIINCTGAESIDDEEYINTTPDGKIFEEIFEYYHIDFSEGTFYNSTISEVTSGIKNVLTAKPALSEEDTIYVHIACHGSEDGLYMAFVDLTKKETALMPYQALFDLFKTNNEARKVIFIDACHSESMIDSIEVLRRTKFDSLGDEALDSKWMIFFSSWPKQYSFENSRITGFKIKHTGGVASHIWAAGIRDINNKNGSVSMHNFVSFGELHDFTQKYCNAETNISIKHLDNSSDENQASFSVHYYCIVNPIESVVRKATSMESFARLMADPMRYASKKAREQMEIDFKRLKGNPFRFIVENPSDMLILNMTDEEREQTLFVYYQILSNYPETPGHLKDEFLFERKSGRSQNLILSLPKEESK